MAQERHNLTASARTAKANQVRNQGSVPGVIYGHGREPQNIEVESRAFLKVFRQAGTSSLVMLSLDGQEYPVLLREVQYHPLKDVITHVDMYQVRMDEAIEATVPLEFNGEASAVKDLGGVLVKSVDELDIEALPQNLPHNISVDISVLTDFEKVIHVSDLTIPEGVTVRTEADTVVALVQPPRSEAEMEALEGEITEDVTAVEGVKEEVPAEEAPKTGEEQGE